MSTTVSNVRQFKMPDVGEGLTEAEILKWYVQPGDTVTDGQIVCEVETAKAAVELPIPFDGVVQELFFAEGTTVDVGTAIISVAVEGGAPAEAPTAPAAVAADEEPEPERREVLVGYGPRSGSSRRRARKPAATAAPTVVQTGGEAVYHAPAPVAPVASAPVAPVAAAPVSDERPLAKPPVRKLAKDLGVDLAAVTPTGPHGNVTREDVHAHVAAASAPAAPVAPVAAAPVAAAPVVSAEGDTRVPIKGVRKATAAAMVSSAFTAPHVTEWVQVDVTRTMKLVAKLKETGELGAGVRVSPLLLVAKALLIAIKRHPEINASWDEAAQEIVIKRAINLGIAAATPRGLIVPNIKDAGSMALPDLAQALTGLIEVAREGKTSPAAMQGGTVTITNVGVFGVDSGTPILNPGEAAILAFGQVRELPWVHKGRVVPRLVTTLALSFDHRMVDGELGSKVLADTAAILADPKKLISWQ
ncbi:dihydrolipoamide acetyltransferase family protein [Streptacidiphilus jiangxiensis]|uniref:Dihydrolipoamide acetyltransferase component of pyruvate dehydrogenase complex n=1 Tax=Streptacidiphilus jiangxiensis TaxID=235985 RepID=A0A1H7JJ61_STRJI|nr:dihydrolipoamide acetyltransferase family protein [Streptacidiphilus jiangxiensis]SEK74633.1 pyruvate dehydrogenase E2 component (dihydrolipoamide acetyltransferase) [Streptacidiphilus jiangxiensis]